MRNRCTATAREAFRSTKLLGLPCGPMAPWARCVTGCGASVLQRVLSISEQHQGGMGGAGQLYTWVLGLWPARTRTGSLPRKHRTRMGLDVRHTQPGALGESEAGALEGERAADRQNAANRKMPEANIESS